MTEVGLKSVSKLPVVAYGACDGGREKEGKIRPRKEHVGLCQHQRGGGERINQLKTVGGN